MAGKNSNKKRTKKKESKSRSQRYIQYIGSPILRKEIVSSCSEYSDAEKRKKLVDSPGWKSYCNRAFMVYRLMHKKDAAAISANQLNFPFPAFIWSPNGKFEIVLCPKVTVAQDSIEVPDMEGCLSLPGDFFPVKRESKIILEGYDHFGEPLPSREFSGFFARVVQHEVDHLNGRMIIDYQEENVKCDYLDSIRRRDHAVS